MSHFPSLSSDWANCPSGSFILMSHCRLLWSVHTVKGLPNRYWSYWRYWTVLWTPLLQAILSTHAVILFSWCQTPISLFQYTLFLMLELRQQSPDSKVTGVGVKIEIEIVVRCKTHKLLDLINICGLCPFLDFCPFLGSVMIPRAETTRPRFTWRQKRQHLVCFSLAWCSLSNTCVSYWIISSTSFPSTVISSR